MGRGMKSQQGLTDQQIDEGMFGGWIDAAQEHYRGQQGETQDQGASTTTPPQQ